MIDKGYVNKRDLICGLILILFSVSAFIYLTDLPFRAAIFPQVMLAGIFSLASLLILKSLNIFFKTQSLPESGKAGAAAETPKQDQTNPEDKKALVATLVSITLYIVLMPVLGFLLSSILFLFTILFVLKMRRYFLMAFLAILTSSLVFVVFKTVMYISLPGGIFDPTELLYRLIG